jgi:hypothetical protein
VIVYEDNVSHATSPYVASNWIRHTPQFCAALDEIRPAVRDLALRLAGDIVSRMKGDGLVKLCLHYTGSVLMAALNELYKQGVTLADLSNRLHKAPGDSRSDDRQIAAANALMNYLERETDAPPHDVFKSASPRPTASPDDFHGFLCDQPGLFPESIIGRPIR